jgi:hypothetical protein
VIETAVCKRQFLRVALYAVKVEAGGTWHGTPQHPVRQVESGITVLMRQMWKVKTGADAIEQHTRRRMGQGGQAPGPLGTGCRSERRIIKRRNQRIAVFKAQSG